VVLLPGLGPQHAGSGPRHRALQRLEVGLLARSFTVFILARPTGLARGTTIGELAARYAATITTHFSSPVDLIGVSTGGSIALQLAIDHPNAMNRLVLVSAAFRLGDDGRTAQQAIAENLRLRRPRRAAATMLATTTTRPGHRTLRHATGLALGRLALGQRSEDLIAILEAEDHFDVQADLSRVASPTLVIGGGQDGYYPTDLFTRTAAGVADGTFVELPDRSHLGLATDRRVARTIRDFLTPTPATADTPTTPATRH
jgi:pimeloyl-ACP methyl ester carboxylesterase